MNLIDPIGNPRWAPLLLRVVLGVWCLQLAFWGYSGQPQFQHVVATYSGFKGLALDLYVTVSPVVLFLSGAFLILGLMTTLGTLLAMIVFAPLLYASGASEAMMQPLTSYFDNRTFFRDILTFTAFASLLLSGPGALSLDSLMRGLYKNVGENKKGLQQSLA